MKVIPPDQQQHKPGYPHYPRAPHALQKGAPSLQHILFCPFLAVSVKILPNFVSFTTAADELLAFRETSTFHTFGPQLSSFIKVEISFCGATVSLYWVSKNCLPHEASNQS